MNLETDILSLLPHRPPMLMVDRVVASDAHSCTAIKNISHAEPCFQGHFPGNPVFPGVLTIEALAQTCVICLRNRGDEKTPLFAGINSARFKRMVRPGDQLQLKAQLLGEHYTRMLVSLDLPEEGQEDIAFSDVSSDYWAYDALKNAVARGWLKGYDGNTLKPENNITRTEAILVLNRMLDRSPDKNAINNAGKILQYLDVPYGYWAYYDIMEASVPHEHSENEDGGEVWTSFTLKTSDREPGYYLEDGQLYCVKEDGYYAKSEAIGVLDFNSDGQYTSGSADLDQRLTAIVLAYTDPSASRFTNLRSLYNYVVRHCTYRNNLVYIREGATGWEAERALDMLKAGNKGNCYNFAALFTMLARRLGYQATGISGWVTTPDWGWEYDTHGWVEINEGGKVYLCDPEETWAYGWDLFYKSYGTTYTHYMVHGVSLG